MKSRLGLRRKYREFIAYINLIRFTIRRYFIGFDYANLFIQRVDKISLQLILKSFGAKIGKDCDIETGLVFHNCESYNNLIVGDNCHIGKDCFFDLRDKIEISDNVVISMQCTFITHVDMTKSELSKLFPPSSEKIIIYKNCYVGAKSMILKGVVLEESSFVAANSLVNKIVKSLTIVAGVPAIFLKKIK